MPEDEARGWARTLEMDPPNKYGSFQKWTLRLVADDPSQKAILEGGISVVWSAIMKIRPPCFRHGRPSILFRSEPAPHAASNSNSVLELERMPSSEYYIHFHNPELPEEIRAEDFDRKFLEKMERPELFITSRIFDGLELSFNTFGRSRSPCDSAWSSDVQRAERRPTCPRCGEFGTGEGRIGNERRFFHERNRSCYLGVVENRLKRNPLVKCVKCGEMGREHRGKDGHARVRHDGRTCYVG
jgi:hypothetical protein